MFKLSLCTSQFLHDLSNIIVSLKEASRIWIQIFFLFLSLWVNKNRLCVKVSLELRTHEDDDVFPDVTWRQCCDGCTGGDVRDSTAMPGGYNWQSECNNHSISSIFSWFVNFRLQLTANRRSSEIQGTALGKCLPAWTCTYSSMPAGVAQSRHAFVGDTVSTWGRWRIPVNKRQKWHQKCRSSAHCSWGTCRSDSRFPQLVV